MRDWLDRVLTDRFMHSIPNWVMCMLLLLYLVFD